MANAIPSITPQMVQQWLAQWGNNPNAGSINAQGQNIGGNQNLGGTNWTAGFPKFNTLADALSFVQQAYSPNLTASDLANNATDSWQGGFHTPGLFSKMNVDFQEADLANPSQNPGGQTLAQFQNQEAGSLLSAERGQYPMLDTGGQLSLSDVLIHGFGPALSGLATAGASEFLGPLLGAGSGGIGGALGLSPEASGVLSFLGSAGSQALMGGTPAPGPAGTNSLNNASGLLQNFAQTGANPISRSAMTGAPGVQSILNAPVFEGHDR